MPSKKKTNRSHRQQDEIANSTSTASLTTQYAPSSSAPLPTMYENMILDNSLQPTTHLGQANESSNSSANIEFFSHASQAESNSVVTTSFANSAIRQPEVPPGMKPPAKRKAAAASSERRITRTKKNNPWLEPLVFKASRAHLLAPSPDVHHYSSQAGASNTEQEAASSLIHVDNLPTPISGMMQPHIERSSTPIVLKPCMMSDINATPPKFGKEGRHQEPNITDPPTIQAPWFPLNAAPILPLPRQQAIQYSAHPLSPLNRSLSHDLPPQITSMYPVPKGLEDPATEPAGRPKPELMEIDKSTRLIVTYRRLGFRFDEIATKLHLAGYSPDAMTPVTVERSWRKADIKEFPPWYGDGGPKLRAFEMDDPNYL